MATLNFATKEEAKLRLNYAKEQRARAGSPSMRNHWTREILQIEGLLGAKSLPSAQQVTQRPERATTAEVMAAASKPPLFVDDYKGPRCEYCAGPKPNGTCLNAGPDWPHPPDAQLAGVA